MSDARSDRAQKLGVTGAGVKVAVFENGPANQRGLKFAARYTDAPNVTLIQAGHSRLTSAIIKNDQEGGPHGHAPDCDLYSANSSDNIALTWAAEQGCTVISQSFHRDEEPRSGARQSDDILKDWIAIRPPFPTIVSAAGNFWKGDPDGISPPQDEYVNHKGYNTITVGNHKDKLAGMVDGSVFRNPTSTHGDWELPDLAANGDTVSAVGESGSGTSFAAPAVAGIVALLQQADTVLKFWPEGNRAVLYASASRNLSDSSWWADVGARDARDGVGAVDAEAAVRIAKHRQRPGKANVSSIGYDVGYNVAGTALSRQKASSGKIGNPTLIKREEPSPPDTSIYYVRAKSLGLTTPMGGAPAHPAFVMIHTIRIALAWSIEPTELASPDEGRMNVDLDLQVFDDARNLVAHSSSYDNSYEVLEFTAVVGKIYEVFIIRSSGDRGVPFGIAWTTISRPIFPLPAPKVVAGG